MKFVGLGLRSVCGLAIVVALLAVACSGGNGQAAQPGPTLSARIPTVAASATIATAAVLDQSNLEFVPATVTVKVGETVLIKNSDPAVHTANINGKNVTGAMGKNTTVVWKAAAPGQYSVTCDYHPLMKATIVVTP